jgi:hypothetical protein
VEFWVVD